MDRRLILIATLVGTTLFAVLANSQEGLSLEDSIGALRSPRRDDRSVGYDNISRHRTQLLQELIEIAKDDPPSKLPFWPSKAAAIDALALSRPDDAFAVDFLIEEISYRGNPRGRPLSILGGYTSAQALVKIGTPSLEGISRRLGQPVNLQEIQLFAAVYRGVLGQDIGRTYLGRELEKDIMAEKKKRLEKLIEIFERGRVQIGPGGPDY